jgi:hypothetical protein
MLDDRAQVRPWCRFSINVHRQPNSGASVIAAVPRCDRAMSTSHLGFLMVRHGYVRALWLPQETAASTDVQSLVQLVGQLAKRQRHSLTVSHGVFPFHGAVNVHRHGRSSFDYKKSMPKTTLAAWLRGNAAHGTSRIVASKQQRRQHDNPSAANAGRADASHANDDGKFDAEPK